MASSKQKKQLKLTWGHVIAILCVANMALTLACLIKLYQPNDDARFMRQVYEHENEMMTRMDHDMGWSTSPPAEADPDAYSDRGRRFWN